MVIAKVELVVLLSVVVVVLEVLLYINEIVNALCNYAINRYY